jgi:hypothetical protein
MAETFYVCQGGDGTSYSIALAATAWDADDVSTSANWASPKVNGKIGPGDTIYFMSDGGTITGTGGSLAAAITIYKNGTAIAPITLQGDGSAVISGENGVAGVGTHNVISGTDYDYITIQNLELSYGYNSVIKAYDSHYWTITNCDIHDCTPPATTAVLLSAYGTHWTIDHNTFHDVVEDHCIYFYSKTGGGASTDIVIEYNSFDNPAVASVQFNGVDEWFTGCVIRYNWFEDPGYNDIENNTCDGLEIYGNIFVHTSIVGNNVGMHIGDDSTGDAHAKNTKIWNNTFYGYFDVLLDTIGYHTVGTDCISECYNNIFSMIDDTGGGGPYYVYLRGTNVASNITAMDYNLYHSDVTGHWVLEDNSDKTSLAAWKAATIYDDNSIEGDPLFSNAAGSVFTLAGGSPGLGSGSAGAPTNGLSPAVRKSDFGRGGTVNLVAFDATNPNMGAYASIDPIANPSNFVMVMG